MAKAKTIETFDDVGSLSEVCDSDGNILPPTSEEVDAIIEKASADKKISDDDFRRYMEYVSPEWLEANPDLK